MKLAAALLLALALQPRGAQGVPSCPYTLQLPAGSGVTAAADAASAAGSCDPYAADGAVCDGISVPGGAVLAYGTCALPGAACTGSTLLQLASASGTPLAGVAPVSRVALNSSVAALAKGCVLGVKCSYGEWRNPSLTPTSVAVLEGCYGKSACAGVVAWAVTEDPQLLSAPQPTATPALAFRVTAGAQATTLTGLGSAAPSAALSVNVLGRVGTDPFTAGAIGANTSGWTTLYSGSWTGASVVFTTSLAVNASQSAAVVVVNSSGAGRLPCANTLGTPGAQLITDGAVTMSQGGALVNPFAGAVAVPGAACGVDGLVLAYNLTAACAPAPSPPPAPVSVGLTPTTMVLTLGDLQRALADVTVLKIVINQNIALSGTQLAATVSGTRTLTIEGGNGCGLASLCSLSARGGSRIFALTPGLTLTVSKLQLRDGVAPAGQFGGCVVANCANCALQLESVVMQNCSAANAGGGALAVLGGATLVASNMQLGMNTAAVGGGLLVSGGTVSLNSSVFSRNVATGSAEDLAPAAAALSDLPGTAGGGLALYGVTGSVTGCSFSGNIAKTSEFVLLGNPDVEQARGGGLFASDSALNVTGGVFNNNSAYYGGGAYLDVVSASFQTSAFVGNLASLGDGGALFVSDCEDTVALLGSVVSSNAAGGHMGGGVAAFNASVHVQRSTLTANSAPHGCGGAAGLDVGAKLTVDGGSTVSANSADNGGGLCCNECDAMLTADSFLYGNTATTAGGALYSSWSPTVVLNSSLTGNSAPAGGAVAAVSASLNVTNCTLFGNEATATHGGAIWHNSEDDGLYDLVLSTTALTNNTCAGAGGAVAAFWSASAVITSCVFTNNSIHGPAPTGGGLMSLNVANLAVQDCSFTSNWVTMASSLAQDALLGYVSAVAAPGVGNGGALWIGADEPMNASVANTDMTLNFADSGGGIYATGAVVLTVSGSTFDDNTARGISSQGGCLMTDMAVMAAVSDTTFLSCAAVRGGAAWHGGASQTNYSTCEFKENEALVGDITRGSALYTEASSQVAVSQSNFVNNVGHGLCEGTVAMARSATSGLSIADSLFDGNSAKFGGCIMTAAHTQSTQLSLSGVVFQNNAAYAGGVLYSEADEWTDLQCGTCDATLNNTASDWGQIMATPAKDISISLPSSVRSGAPMPNSVTLTDGFQQLLAEWDNLVVTISTTDALVSGSLRTFYTNGEAVFSSLALKGNESASYSLVFTLSGPNLFGNGVEEQQVVKTVTVQACDEGETWDDFTLDCACAVGYGLIVTDHTCQACTANEVVPPGGLSCRACPALSSPVSLSQCECHPGLFGLIVGATGACSQCPADTYRSASDPSNACIPCPATSHTFAAGATSEKDCLCAAEFFNDKSGDNSSFACAPVPLGGWAPQADSRLFALENYWRPSPHYAEFFRCTSGMCLRETPKDVSGVNASQTGYKCRDGHSGHLCAVCTPGHAYQGNYCKQCKPGQRFEEWPMAQRAMVIVLGLAILLLGIFLLFFLPLFPHVEQHLEELLQPAVASMERALGTMTAATRPRTAGTRHSGNSAGTRSRPTSPARVARLTNTDAMPRLSYLARTRRTSLSLIRRRSQSVAGVSGGASGGTNGGAHGGTAAADDDPRQPAALNEATIADLVERPSRVRVFFDLIAEPVRIVVSFWQIVSSFSGNLYVPWPSLYYALSNSLDVVSLQFLQLPAIACIQPDVKFTTVFNGVTISTLIFCIFCMSTYHLGQKTTVAREDPERRQRFKSRCLNVFIWGLFLIYPQVSSTTLLIFACTDLEDGTAWLMADYRIQCWTPEHRSYVGIGIIWAILFPFGIPAGMIYFMWRSRVPELASWKSECAWLRSIVHRAMVIGASPRSESFDPDSISTDSITVEHLRVLHGLFVSPSSTAAEEVLKIKAPTRLREQEQQHGSGLEQRSPTVRHRAEGLSVRFQSDFPERPGTAGSDVVLPDDVPEDDVLPDSSNDIQAEPTVRQLVGGGALITTGALGVPQATRLALLQSQAAEPGAEPSAPAARRRWSTRLQRGGRGSSLGLRPRSSTENWFLSFFRRLQEEIGMEVTRMATQRAKTIRRTLSSILYSNERVLLLKSLLEWAKHDKHCLVSEPRHNQMRWRTHYEWQALLTGNIQLGDHDSAEQAAYSKFAFLFSGYSVHAWYWEVVDLGQKLFLTSLITFIAPHTAVQVIVAAMFAFVLLLVAVQVKPFRDKPCNQLLALSQMNIFLFLWTGLLLQTNPEGITGDQILFSVIVGILTTSIVAFTAYLFARELAWQLMAALREVDEEEAAEELEWELADEAADDNCHDPTVGLTPPGPPTRAGRLTLRFAVVIALTIGLGLGLNRETEETAAVVRVDAVSRFTLVLAREALPGSDKLQVTVNGSVPGPTLRVPFGNRAEVTVINNIFDDASVMHWHGMQQRGTPYMDGVVGVTQCPISNSPGYNTMVYDFLPDRAGTFWYHGHYNGQYPDGLYGPLIIDDGGATFAAATYGNASYAYDNDEWIWMSADWYNVPAHELLPEFMSPESHGVEPMPDAIVVNDQFSGANLSFKTSRKTRQLVRVINAAAWSMFTVTVDGMPLLLVELDGTAVEPVYLPYVELNVAQRASFILDWSLMHADVADSPSVWFRFLAMTNMYPDFDPYAPDMNLHGTAGKMPFAIEWTGLIHFDGSDAVPSYQAAPELTAWAKPKEVNLMSARSYPPMPAPNATHTMYMEMTMEDDEDGVHRWYVNGETVKMLDDEHMMMPSLRAYASPEGGEYTDVGLPASGALNGTAAVPFIAPYMAVIDILVNNTHRGEHPFHLHGHDLWIVDSSGEPDGEALYGPNFVRRDVVSVSAGGWARMRFVADNPGIWVHHCHTDWHMHSGMMVTIIEAPSELQRRAAAGELVTSSPSHLRACEAPQTLLSVVRSAAMHKHHGGR